MKTSCGRCSRLSQSVVVIENEHGKKLDVLFDGYKSLSDKMDYMQSIVETTAKDMSIVKAVVTSHTEIVSVLKAVI